MAFATAYLDESESDPFFVLAGLISSPSGWNRFSREWIKVLKEYEVPSLHMKEFAFFKKAFKGWTEGMRRSFLNRLLFLVNSPREPIYSFSAIFNFKDYDEIFPPKFQRQQNHYFFAFQSCMTGIKMHCNRHELLEEGETIDLVFGRQAQYSGRAVKIFNNYKIAPFMPEEERLMLGSLSFADDEIVIPLQAADLLAYEINKNQRGFVRHAGTILNELPGTHVKWSKELLLEYARRMKKELHHLFSV
jgi:hypothetical protein